MAESAETESPGWDAIDEALRAIYGEQTPHHFGAALPWALGGKNPLQGISAYRRDEPVPHWHFVTYGLTELYAKENKDLQHSGYGFELSLRLADADETPPHWALNLLQNLARYVFNTGNVFAHGHYLNLNGPIALGRDTAIRSIVFVRDPELPAKQTENGRMEFLQVVGITLDEEAALKQWSADGLLSLIAKVLPLFVTDLTRTSALVDPDLAAKVAEGVSRDGSNTSSLFIGPLGWTRSKRVLRGTATEVRIGAGQVDELVALLPLRLPFGRALSLVGAEACIEFRAAEKCDIVEAEQLEMHLDAAAVREIAATLKPRVGSYPIRALPGLSFCVQLTEIRDSDGNLVNTVG